MIKYLGASAASLLLVSTDIAMITGISMERGPADPTLVCSQQPLNNTTTRPSACPCPSSHPGDHKVTVRRKPLHHKPHEKSSEKIHSLLKHPVMQANIQRSPVMGPAAGQEVEGKLTDG